MGGIDHKKALRKQILINRGLLSEEKVQDLSQLVATQVGLYLETNDSFEAFHIFLPIQHQKEVNTWPILKSLDTRNKKVYVSESDFSDQSMKHILYHKGLQFENDDRGIPTPVNGPYAEMNDLDVMFVPLLGADKRGSRIGYGKGFYDRFIASLNRPVITVGLSLAPCFDNFPFMELHDQHLDYCITPFEIIDCAYVRNH